MLRAFFIHLAWFLLPFLVYALYRIALARLFPHAEPAKKRPSRGVLAWLAVVGLLLVAASLFALALLEGEPVGKDYAPPRFEQGRVVPGQFE